MKGTSFQNGVEFKITIDGESWQQGQSIQGALASVSRSASVNPLAPADAPLPRVVLAESTDRKIKNKSAEAFTIIAEATGAEAVSAWKFEIPIQARITDKAGSLFILYGASPNGAHTDLHALGMLKLNIQPHHYLQDIIEMMRTEYRFALKSITAGKKGWIEVELTPPGSKDWAQLDHLILQLRLSVDEAGTFIESKFDFNRAEVDAMKAGLSTKLTQRTVEREWDKAEFVHDFNDRLNKDVTQAAIHQVIEEYRSIQSLG